MSDTDFPIAHAGTPSFVPLLLTYVRNASSGLPIEPVIFQSILLCLLSGNKHLILRTAEDDVGLVVKLAVKTLATVFGIVTHRLRIHRRTDLVHDLTTAPSVLSFLRSLFVPSPGASLSVHLAQDETSTLTGHGTKKYRKRPGSRSRSRSATVRSMTSQYNKSLSYPNDLMSAKSLHTVPSLSLSASDPFGDYHSPIPLGLASSHPLSSTSRNSSLSALPQPSFPHSHSDPTPLRLIHPTPIQLPDALVVSGLENASLPSQRALTTVLSEGRVVLDDVGDSNDIEMRGKGQRHSRSSTFEIDTDLSGIWPLPINFILVYVCPTDERERPTIHKALLDKFAMSATVSLHPTIHSLARNFFYPNSHRGSPILSPIPQHANSTPPFLTQPLPHRHISPGIMTPSNDSHAIITPQSMLLLKEIYSKVQVPPALTLYASDLFSAARHHHQLEGRLLSISATNDALDLSRAARVLGGDPTGMELINDIFHSIGDGYSTTDGASRDGDERLSKAMTDIGSTYVVIDSRLDVETRLSTEGVPERSEKGEVLPVLDVTQADVARIVPRVLSHRLRVRDGPEDEVLGGAVFGAAFSASSRKEERGRKADREGNRVTVKELLVKILQDV